MNRGVELRKRGDDAGALDAFLKAYGLAKSPRALAQVALAEQALGRWVDAEAHLSQAVVHGDDPWIARNKAVLDQTLSEIQVHLGSVELLGGVPGAEVRLNGTPVGLLPLKTPIRALAGSVAVEVRAEGYLTLIRTVMIPSGGLARESVILISTGAAVHASPIETKTSDAMVTAADQSSSGWGVRRDVAVGLGVAAVGGLVVGTTFLVLRNSRAIDFKNAGCTTLDDGKQSPVCQSLENREGSALTLGVAGLIGAAVFGGVGAYLFLTSRPAAASRGGTALSRRTLAFHCLPAAGSEGIACAGEF
jgi:hypothetical protein